jgi:hypothetical protein
MRITAWLTKALFGAAAVAATGAAAATPDISGVWQPVRYIQELRTVDGAAPPLKPAAAKIYEENRKKWLQHDFSYDVTSTCVPPGMPRSIYLPYPFEIIQRPQGFAYLFQWNYMYRTVDMAGGKRVVDYPLRNGFSDATWKGDTLVIDTIGRSDNTLLDASGLPNSDKLHLVEQLKLANNGQTLIDRITIDDPEIFERPWDTVIEFRRLPKGTEIKEDVCVDRIDAGKPAVEVP